MGANPVELASLEAIGERFNWRKKSILSQIVINLKKKY